MSRPKSFTVTSANSPFYIPMNWRAGTTAVTATPSGSGDYDVAYTLEDISISGSNGAENATDYVDIEEFSAATAQASRLIGPCTALRVTLNSGTSVKVDITQTDE